MEPQLASAVHETIIAVAVLVGIVWFLLQFVIIRRLESLLTALNAIHRQLELLRKHE